ncbi:MAG TPA: hypothetical protein VNF74_15330 [Terriglobales bacterium]|nr:hypothetical protein [Terriglobales bacterium]
MEIYERVESPATPAGSLISGRTAQARLRQDLDGILEVIAAVLASSGAAEDRAQIRRLRAANEQAHERIGHYRERMISAPDEADQGPWRGLVEPSKEHLGDSIADERDNIVRRDLEVARLKAAFHTHLGEIGIEASPELLDCLLLPLQDAFVNLHAAITNLIPLSQQLQVLVEASQERPAEAKRYYGFSLMLILAVERMQALLLAEIAEEFLPRLAELQREASTHLDDAQRQLRAGGPKEVLLGNLDANRQSLEACRVLMDFLTQQRVLMIKENHDTKILAAAASNTYRTMRTGFEIAELIDHCEQAFGLLRSLKLPPLRPFRNLHLSDQLQRLAERVATKE